MKDNEQNFTELKKLLKLKQHEVPPPGYFNHCSGDVISRIRAGEAGASTFTERLEKQAPWLMNYLHIFEAKPGIVVEVGVWKGAPVATLFGQANPLLQSAGFSPR